LTPTKGSSNGQSETHDAPQAEQAGETAAAPQAFDPEALHNFGQLTVAEIRANGFRLNGAVSLLSAARAGGRSSVRSIETGDTWWFFLPGEQSPRIVLRPSPLKET
jgi:hypothetical protein